MNRDLAPWPFGRDATYSSEAPRVDRHAVDASDPDAVIRFRRFRVLPRARQLLADGEPVEIGARAFDLLMALIDAHGGIVSKDAIMNRVWPSTVVEENNLHVQVSALRKALGNDRDVIKTVPGRGYVFAGTIAKRSAEPGALTLAGPWSAAPPSTMPALGPPLRHWPNGHRAAARHNEVQPTVVVIDDDRDVREALQGLLRSSGMQVELFASVQEFLGSARPVLPGCIVLDVWLPGRNGLDFYADLARASVHLPVIFISGHADIPMSVRAMKAGAVEFLTKPVRHQDLLNAIQVAIESTSSPSR